MWELILTKAGGGINLNSNWRGNLILTPSGHTGPSRRCKPSIEIPSSRASFSQRIEREGSCSVLNALLQLCWLLVWWTFGSAPSEPGTCITCSGTSMVKPRSTGKRRFDWKKDIIKQRQSFTERGSNRGKLCDILHYVITVSTTQFDQMNYTLSLIRSIAYLVWSDELHA